MLRCTVNEPLIRLSIAELNVVAFVAPNDVHIDHRACHIVEMVQQLPDSREFASTGQVFKGLLLNFVILQLDGNNHMLQHQTELAGIVKTDQETCASIWLSIMFVDGFKLLAKTCANWIIFSRIEVKNKKIFVLRFTSSGGWNRFWDKLEHIFANI